MKYYFETKDLAVGYNGSILIHDINIQIEKGKILTLIGPNGAGKSTVLKTITKHLASIKGTVSINRNEISQWTPREMAKQVAVVLTDRIRPELMTCAEVVAMGRYPYTNMLGRLTPEDRRIVEESLGRVHALDLAEQDFATLSDGQRQRILLARAICQEPEIIVLDEPTAYLDIRHKIELLDILREMAQEKGIKSAMLPVSKRRSRLWSNSARRNGKRSITAALITSKWQRCSRSTPSVRWRLPRSGWRTWSIC